MKHVLKVKHVYQTREEAFETAVNDALAAIMRSGGEIEDIKYVSDPPSPDNQRGGFGALILYEIEYRESEHVAEEAGA